jgi:four helix bundle protein
MTYEAFEELPVWKEAVLLIEEIYRLTTQSSFRGPASFRAQIESAALSVSNNIAEGFERGTKPALLTFLYIARGSAGETRSMLRLLARNPRWGGDPAKGIELALSCSKQIRTWAQYLQNSDIKGPRYLTKLTDGKYVQLKPKQRSPRAQLDVRGNMTKTARSQFQISNFKSQITS